MKYPCSYELKVKFEKDYANLNLDESNNYSNSYSYFVPGNNLEKLNTMKFKIQSSLNKKYTKGKQLLTISVTNPSDKDAIVLKDSKTNEIKTNSFITPMGKIFSIIEGDINNSENSFYYLEIESMEYQFVSISIKASVEYDKKIGTIDKKGYHYKVVPKKQLTIHDETIDKYGNSALDYGSVDQSAFLHNNSQNNSNSNGKIDNVGFEKFIDFIQI